MTKSQNTKNEQQKDLCITVEKQVWESTLRISMERLAEIERLNNDIKNLAKLVLKLSPERKEWLEKHYGEYL